MFSRVCIINILFSFAQSKKSENPSVIIIGAGAAGIAAATKLSENSITNLKIFEAEDRIGGRIHSVHFGDGIVDLGAQYCHGEKGNIAYQLAKNLSILNPGLRGLQNNVFYSNGSRLNSAFIEELKDIYRDYDKVEESFYDISGKSVEDLVTFKYNSALIKKYESDENKLKIVKEGIKFLEGYLLIHEGAFSLSKTSAERDYQKCEGNQALIWKNVGYKAILDIMLQKYPDTANKVPIDSRIHLNTKVQKIEWADSQEITVVTVNRTYRADHVIFTPSIGVLKKQKNKLFSPPLPIPRDAVISNFGFDGVVKIFLHFSKKWWDDEDQAFSFYWSEEDLESYKFLGDEAWITQFRYILKVPDNPNVWVGWISGNFVPHIEKLPLDKLKLGIQQVLKTFLGKKNNITEIDNIIRSQWCTNENFGGTYSFTSVGSYDKDVSPHKLLEQPLHNPIGKPVLLFAGEVTHSTHYSTVHGAIETGYREARRIIRFYGKNSTSY